MSMTGERGSRPLIAGVHVGDTGSGLHCAIGVLAALYQRQFTGQGQRIEVAMQEAVISLSRALYAAHPVLKPGEAIPRKGNSSARHVYAPSDIFPCKGGGTNDYCFIHIKGSNVRPWDALLRVAGREDLIGDERYATPKARSERIAEVNDIVTQWTRQHDKRAVMKALGAVGVYASAVMDSRDLENDPHLRKRGAFATVNHPVRGEFTIPGCAIQMSGSPVQVRPAPLLGADNEDVYGELLGITADELSTLREQKII
jgi:formyl-CoA transferase